MFIYLQLEIKGSDRVGITYATPVIPAHPQETSLRQANFTESPKLEFKLITVWNEIS